ncbi:MAG TPA: hypothetical protein VF864_03820 [Gemmatimonadales bacterium]
MKPSRLRFAAMAISAGVLVLNCGDPTPVAPDLPSPVFATSQSSPSGLLRCRPMAYDSVTAVIGPSGGDIKVSRHVLSISGGTFKQPTTITAVAPSDSLNRIRFQPEGLTFNKPVALVMSYANCTLNGSSPKEIVYTDDGLKVLEHEPSRDDPAGKRVAALLTHFSQYAVAW